MRRARSLLCLRFLGCNGRILLRAPMAARLAALALPAARPAAPLRASRARLPSAAPQQKRAAQSPANQRLGRVRAAGEQSHMGDPDRRAVDKSEWLEAEAYGPVSAYCSAGPVASCTPDTPLSDILYHFEEFTGATSRSFSRALAQLLARPPAAERCAAGV